MKKKNILFSLAATLMICAVAMCGMTSCTNEDNVDKKQAVNEARTYTVSIPANIGGGETRAVEFGTDGSSTTSKFKTTDVIHAFWYNTDHYELAGTLTPDANAASAKLTGVLTGVATGTNNLLLCYNLTEQTGTKPGDGLYDSNFKYNGQTGAATSAASKDFATATVSITDVSGSSVTTTAATFEHLQSMFRQRLSFVDADGTTPISPTPTISTIFIQTENSAHMDWLYQPLPPTHGTTSLIISSPTITTDGDIYFAIRFNSDLEATEKLIISCYDTDGNYYTVTKTPPTGGFQNGNYYYGTATMKKIPALHRLSASNVGYVVCDNGIVVYDVSSVPAGHTAVAMIAHVGAIAGVCEHGLAISLDLPLSGTWAEANTYVSGLTAVPYATWRLPTIADWQYIFIGCGATGSYSATPTTLSSAEINAKITAADGTGAVLVDCDYWTATESGSAVWSINFSADGNTATFNSGTDKTGSCRPRAVLAF